MTIAGWTSSKTPPTPLFGEVPNYLVAVYYPLLKQHVVNEAFYLDGQWHWLDMQDGDEWYSVIAEKVVAWAEMPSYP